MKQLLGTLGIQSESLTELPHGPPDPALFTEWFDDLTARRTVKDALNRYSLQFSTASPSPFSVTLNENILEWGGTRDVDAGRGVPSARPESSRGSGRLLINIPVTTASAEICQDMPKSAQPNLGRRGQNWATLGSILPKHS
ncbi:hypothetical protein C8R46DRAFT_1040859 [Mycena filopes]|nr:hypothetical protein C8R46DRAFT_1040859 [Mycena filopes]